MTSGDDGTTMWDQIRNALNKGRSGLQSVIGEENRTRILETGVQPYAAICSIEISENGSSKGFATGFLIAPNRVVTAAHNLRDFNIFADKVRITPGRTAAREPNGPSGTKSVNRSGFRFFPGWTTERRQDQDVALILLEDPFPADHATLPLRVIEPAMLAGRTGEIAGFPTCVGNGCETGESNDLAFPERGKVMFRHRQSIAAAANGLVYYPVDTWNGQSGAPLLVGEGDAAHVVAVHTQGRKFDSADALLRLHNGGVRLTNEMIGFLSGE